jgi:4'-phosphopantetheinyl transferase
MIKFINSSHNLHIISSKCLHQIAHIQNNQLHIWYIPFNKNLVDYDILSSDELLRASEYKFNLHKYHFLVYRCALRKILSYYHDLHPKQLIFRYSSHGKPYVPNNPLSIQFNFSHSSGIAVLGITKYHPIGIDIELIKPLEDIKLISNQFLSELEHVSFLILPESERLESFYDIWTKKEAFIKAIGKGLSYQLNKFSVSSAPDEPPRIIEIKNSKIEAEKWLIKSFTIQDNNKLYKMACLIKHTNMNTSSFLMQS